ncbi:hypothetical protein HY632_03295 [Candidatus Uhrbacteria bacterium]|nr:hypothetical protein [Candidatus Uhrbacteria bacterium]
MIEDFLSEVVGQMLVSPLVRWPGALVAWLVRGGRTKFWADEVARHPRRNFWIGIFVDVALLAGVVWYLR